MKTPIVKKQYGRFEMVQEKPVNYVAYYVTKTTSRKFSGYDKSKIAVLLRKSQSLLNYSELLRF